jgi:4-amino-4-deoxy-L-arabinose transferase-like glycosyltransferase
VTPDMCVSAVVYLATGLLLRMQKQRDNWTNFILLGVVLGCGYLIKYPLFPLAFVFLTISVFSIGSKRKGLTRALVALMIFLAIGGPLFVAFSRRAGHITFEDSGRLNYAWNVNGVPAYAHWQGGSPGDGKATHTTREGLEGISVYEFEKPTWGTYSLWYNPVYWHEGLHVHFHLNKQLAKLMATTKIYFDIFFRIQGALLAGFLMLFMVSGRGWGCLTNIAQQWRLLIIPLAALGMYALVRVDLRFVAPFLILFWSGLASAVEFQANSNESRKVVSCVIVTMAIVVMITTVATTVSVALGDVSRGPNSANSLALVQCRVAEGLRREGIRSGDEVAFIGDSFAAYWARLARVRIVAEIVPEDADTFWAADITAKGRIINAFRHTNAAIIVTDHIPTFSSPGEWRRIEHTDYYFLPLRRPSLSARR